MQEQNRCSAFCTASYYKTATLIDALQKKGATPKLYRSSNVVHSKYGQNGGDVFYFSYGCVITWGLSKSEEQEVLRECATFEDEPVDQVESEESTFSLGQVAKVNKDEIVLPIDSTLTRLALSHALAQTVKLAVFEKLIARIIEETKYIPRSLAIHGKIPLSRKKITQMIGQLFIERNLVNLHTDILDTPEFFWEYSDLEPLYRLCAQDLDISARLEVLNKRVDIVKELFEMLENQLSHRHSTSLEWIIVILIFIELTIAIAADILKVF